MATRKKPGGTGGRPRLSKKGGRELLILSVPPELKAQIVKLAEKRGVSMSELCRKLLLAGLHGKPSAT